MLYPSPTEPAKKTEAPWRVPCPQNRSALIGFKGFLGLATMGTWAAGGPSRFTIGPAFSRPGLPRALARTLRRAVVTRVLNLALAAPASWERELSYSRAIAAAWAMRYLTL
jgi:hypothetical protein